MVKKYIKASKFTAWTKNNIREIQKTKGRFIAIFVIIMLGVGFFCGLSALKPAMIKSANEYINGYANMYDFRFLSTIGFTEADVEYFRSLDGVIMTEGSYNIDFFADTEFVSSLSKDDAHDTEKVLKACSITQRINKVKLVSGRMPTSGNECLVDASSIGANAIGTTIKVSSRNDESTKSFFAYDKFTVVGTCCSVNYLNRTRGTSTLEGGSLDGFIYLTNDAFSSERMTEVFVKTDAAGDIFTDEYNNAIDGYSDYLQSALEERADADYAEMQINARELIDDAWDEYYSALHDFVQSKAEAENQLNGVLDELNQGKAQLDEAKQQLDDAKQAIETGELEYREGLKAYDEGIAEYNSEREAVFARLAEAQGEIDANRNAVEAALALIDQSDAVGTYNSMLERIAELELIMSQIEDHDSPEYIEAYAEYRFLQQQIEFIDETGLPEMYHNLLDSQQQLVEAQAELDRQREMAMAEFEAA